MCTPRQDYDSSPRGQGPDLDLFPHGLRITGLGDSEQRPSVWIPHGHSNNPRTAYWKAVSHKVNVRNGGLLYLSGAGLVRQRPPIFVLRLSASGVPYLVPYMYIALQALCIYCS